MQPDSALHHLGNATQTACTATLGRTKDHRSSECHSGIETMGSHNRKVEVSDLGRRSTVTFLITSFLSPSSSIITHDRLPYIHVIRLYPLSKSTPFASIHHVHRSSPIRKSTPRTPLGRADAKSKRIYPYNLRWVLFGTSLVGIIWAIAMGVQQLQNRTSDASTSPSTSPHKAPRSRRLMSRTIKITSIRYRYWCFVYGSSFT